MLDEEPLSEEDMSESMSAESAVLEGLDSSSMPARSEL